jgi:hypothetical protein
LLFGWQARYSASDCKPELARIWNEIRSSRTKVISHGREALLGLRACLVPTVMFAPIFVLPSLPCKLLSSLTKAVEVLQCCEDVNKNVLNSTTLLSPVIGSCGDHIYRLVAVNEHYVPESILPFKHDRRRTTTVQTLLSYCSRPESTTKWTSVFHNLKRQNFNKTS